MAAIQVSLPQQLWNPAMDMKQVLAMQQRRHLQTKEILKKEIVQEVIKNFETTTE